MTYSPTLYIEASIEAGRTLVLPDVPERGVYVVSGHVRFKDTELEAHSMAILDGSSGVEVMATQDSVIALVGGEAIGPRYMEWNFVATDKALIDRAKENWKAGHFATVPGDEDEFIPFPD